MRPYQPSVKGLRPTAKEQRELKVFKLEVESAAVMALKAQEELRGVYKVVIGNMECLFYPLDQKVIERQLRGFTTTRW